ncbi:hypothetical protein EDD21DRAFT_360652 [Dissophora ornata]|nr:hypothetical protein BGZ58_009528 [Dissophora ornata]KAI8606586.1 hypothetical protein EDD21DRAFT_360652 [Dissophora ornata]
MAPPKKEKMPSMKELQDLLAALDAEGGLSIGGGDGAESTNLDDLYEDSYFHAILHNNIKQDSVEITPSTTTTSPAPSQEDQEKQETSSPVKFDVLTLPEGCSWGDDHESLGSGMLVRPGYAAVLTALTTCNPASHSIFMATGTPGIGKSCLAYYLAYKLFKAGHDIVVSDPMFTSAFVDKQYYSCYSPHLEKHPNIFKVITSKSSTKKPTWWICDDGFLPIKGTRCQVLVTSATAQADSDVETIHKKDKLLPTPIQFQIPKWSLDEIKAGLIVSLSGTGAPMTDALLNKEQELALDSMFKKFKASPRKIFAWAKSNMAETGSGSKAAAKAKSKSGRAKRG